MESMGFPIIRTEIQDNGVHYFCVNPKRTRKNWSFWISLESDGAPRFFMCGLSRLSRQIVGSLTFEGVFERSD
ncbi:MAG: hypothetical protein LV479_05905 [Methylacidiphilales bacterium]|nr:hypothetical protein [Candidatus Methylacidiphilales bacterium]